MSAPIDPVVDLVRNAIGYGVMMALEDKSGLIAKLSINPGGSLADALTADAEGFVRTRADLVEAVGGQETDTNNYAQLRALCNNPAVGFAMNLLTDLGVDGATYDDLVKYRNVGPLDEYRGE